MNTVVAFLPVRKGSTRVIDKNTKDFSGIAGGLTFIKLKQLVNVKEFSRIIVSTDDHKVIEIVKSFNDKRLVIENRPSHLAQNSTSTDELIKYIPSIISNGIVLWTHVTSPFIDSNYYSISIKTYFDNLNKFDSLMSVTDIHKFIWNDFGPLSYDDSIEKWPRTQTLKPLYEINSGIFLADIEIYKRYSNRIGNNPFLFHLDQEVAFDIDWNFDFKFAEMLWKDRYA